MKVQLLKEHCKPTRATDGSAGWDLYVSKDIYVSSNNFAPSMIPLGIKVEVPKGKVVLLFIRSGLANRGFRLVNGVGVIDSDYRGEVCALIRSPGGDNTFKKGDRVAQFIIVDYDESDIEIIDKVSETKRGEGGFGSTGK